MDIFSKHRSIDSLGLGNFLTTKFNGNLIFKLFFSMSIACVGTIVIIMVIAVLCVKSKTDQYKRELNKNEKKFNGFLKLEYFQMKLKRHWKSQ